MGLGLAALAGGQLLGGLLQYDAADKAGDAQLAGVNAGIGEQRRQFELGRSDMAPYREAGVGALGKLSALIDSYRPFDGTELQNDPGYQFGLREGRNQLEQGAAARGGLLSGKTLRDLVQFGNDYGATQFDNRMRMRLGERAQRYNELSGLAGTGQTTAMGGAQLGAQNAGTIADLYTQGGNAIAAGGIGRANAIGNTVGNIGNMYMQQSLLDRIGGGGGYGGGTAGYGSGARANMNAYDLMAGG